MIRGAVLVAALIASAAVAQDEGWKRIEVERIGLYFDCPDSWAVERIVMRWDDQAKHVVYRADPKSGDDGPRVEVDYEWDAGPAEEEARDWARLYREKAEPGIVVEGPRRETVGGSRGYRVGWRAESGSSYQEILVVDRQGWEIFVSVTSIDDTEEERAMARRIFDGIRFRPALSDREKRMAGLYLDQARHAMERGDADTARRFAEKVIEKYPGSAAADEARAILENLDD